MKSYIKHNERGFWANDSAMQFVLAFLHCQLKEDPFFKTKETFLEIVYDNSMGMYASYMHLKLEENLVEKERKLFGLKLLSIIFSLNNNQEDEITLNKLCNYTELQSMERHLPKSMTKENLISYLLKLAYLVEDYL